MSLSPFERMTVWSVLIGGTTGWLGILAANQGMVQKFLSLPTYAKAQKYVLK
jgi:hypothetical protein